MRSSIIFYCLHSHTLLACRGKTDPPLCFPKDIFNHFDLFTSCKIPHIKTRNAMHVFIIALSLLLDSGTRRSPGLRLLTASLVFGMYSFANANPLMTTIPSVRGVELERRGCPSKTVTYKPHMSFDNNGYRLVTISPGGVSILPGDCPATSAAPAPHPSSKPASKPYPKPHTKATPSSKPAPLPHLNISALRGIAASPTKVGSAPSHQNALRQANGNAANHRQASHPKGNHKGNHKGNKSAQESLLVAVAAGVHSHDRVSKHTKGPHKHSTANRHDPGAPKPTLRTSALAALGAAAEAASKIRSAYAECPYKISSVPSWVNSQWCKGGYTQTSFTIPMTNKEGKTTSTMFMAVPSKSEWAKLPPITKAPSTTAAAKKPTPAPPPPPSSSKPCKTCPVAVTLHRKDALATPSSGSARLPIATQSAITA